MPDKPSLSEPRADRASAPEGRSMRGPVLCLGAAAVLLAALAPVQAAIERRRAVIIPSASDDPKVVLFNALGPLKPVAVDLLWIRAQQMQDEGKLHEVLLQCDLITKLQPNLKAVWKFVAHEVFIDIPAVFADEEDAIAWRREGARLMDEGIRHNPNSWVLYSHKADMYALLFDEPAMGRNQAAWSALADRAAEIDPELDPRRGPYALPEIPTGAADRNLMEYRLRLRRYCQLRRFYEVMLELTERAQAQPDARSSERVTGLLIRRWAVLKFHVGAAELIVDPAAAAKTFEVLDRTVLAYIAGHPGDELASMVLENMYREIIYRYTPKWLGLGEAERQIAIDKYIQRLKNLKPNYRDITVEDIIRKRQE
jgi:hypothetical protein